MSKDDENSLPRHIELPRRKRNPPDLIFLASPAYDFFLSLHITFNAPHFEEADLDRQWIAQAKSVCPPDVAQTLSSFFSEDEGQGWCAIHLYGLLHRAPSPHDIPATLVWMRSLPAAEVLIPIMERSGLGDEWREVAASILHSQAIGTSQEDLHSRVMAFSRRFPNADREGVRRLLTDPEGERNRLLTALQTWFELLFADEVPRLAIPLQREVDRQRARQLSMRPAEVLAAVIQGIEAEPPANIAHIVLAPCLMTMPIIFSYAIDDTLTYCYPIEETAHNAAEKDAITRREMVRLFDALADDTRLRILRYLVERQMYLTELSDHLKLTKATTRHHMIRLRAAGLVTLHTIDHLSYYSLRREALDEPTRTLLQYLGSKPES